MARFGTFELDSQRRQLRRGEQDLHLTPKAFDLLSLLVDAAPRVVPKSELHQRLWPAGVVTDATLVGPVKEIRGVIEDTDPQKPLIRTAHRVGYAFDAPVTRAPNVWLDFATVSRRHARLLVSSAGTVLEDLASKNGTSVDRSRITASQPLRNGQQFACGSLEVPYRESGAGLPTATATELSRIVEPSSRG